MRAEKNIYRVFCIILSIQLILSVRVQAEDVWSQTNAYVEQTKQVAKEIASSKFNGMVSQYFENIAKLNFTDKNLVLLNELNAELDILVRQFENYSKFSEEELSLIELNQLTTKIYKFSIKVNQFYDGLSKIALQSSLSVSELQHFISAQFSQLQTMCTRGWQPSTLDVCKLPLKEVHPPDYNFYMDLSFGENGQGAINYYNSTLSTNEKAYFSAGTAVATSLTYGYLVSGTEYALIGGTASGLNMSAALLASAYVAIAVLVVAAIIHISSKNKYYRQTQNIVNAQYFAFKNKATPETVNHYFLELCEANKTYLDKIMRVSSDIKKGVFTEAEVVSDFEKVREQIIAFSVIQSNYSKKWEEIAKKKNVLDKLNTLKAKQKPVSEDTKYASCTEPSAEEKEIEILENQVMEDFEKTAEYKKFNKFKESWTDEKKLEMLYFALRANLYSSMNWTKSIKEISTRASERVSPSILTELQNKLIQLIKLKEVSKTSSFYKQTVLSLERYSFQLFKTLLWKGSSSPDYIEIKKQMLHEKQNFDNLLETNDLSEVQKNRLIAYWTELIAL